MANKHYDEAKVVRQLARKGITVSSTNKSITLPKNPFTPIGIRTYGKLDFLKNYCGYRIYNTDVTIFNENVNNEEKKSVNKKEKNENKIKKLRKENNKENKFNLAKQVKEAMKKVKK